MKFLSRLLSLILLFRPIHRSKGDETNKRNKKAQAFYQTAFQLAETTGDFWVTEKLLQVSVCLAPGEKKYFVALGDVQSKLGRPAQAIQAWRRALRVDAGFSLAFNGRMVDLETSTSENRFRQALATTNESEWKCPIDNKLKLSVLRRRRETRKSAWKAQGSAEPLDSFGPIPTSVSSTAISVANLFASPLVIVNVTAWCLEKGKAPLDHSSMARVAMAGFAEANRDGPMVDEVHGPLTPNNQFFEFQMAHLNEASAEELELAGVGWSELGDLPSWRTLVGTVRDVLQTSPVLDELAGDTERSLYGWISVHQGTSEHASHAHLDARLSAVYYVQVPESSDHTISFWDPRGVSPHLNLRLPQGLTAPPFHEPFAHHPQAGELLIFPSWLMHSVDPGLGAQRCAHAEAGGDLPKTEDKQSGHATAADGMRISASFNIGDGWEGTAPLLVSLS
mmetsp:Transcript_55873/g.111983  ORF Transcript_55873/g.111983 Transcript_55873/m.111983 type:complete len:450 (+) Transcript_55873:115-1464(+)